MKKTAAQNKLVKKGRKWLHDGSITLRSWLYLVALGTVVAFMAWLLDVLYLTVKVPNP